MLSQVMAVVPTVTVTSVLAAKRIPVTLNAIFVGTCVPVPSSDVTLNGSAKGIVIGLVTLKAAARPPASIVVVKMSGCAATICTSPRNSVSVFAPVLSTLTATVPSPGAKPIGITKLICLSVLLTNLSPAAAPLTLSETPLSSTGKAGTRSVSETQLSGEAQVKSTSDGASGTVERTILSSPGARPIGAPGTGLGVGVGLGIGLGTGVAAATGMLLAPVKNESTAADEFVTIGVIR